MRQNAYQRRIPRVRKHKIQYQVSIGYFKKKSVDQCYIRILKESQRNSDRIFLGKDSIDYVRILKESQRNSDGILFGKDSFDHIRILKESQRNSNGRFLDKD